MFNGLYKFTHLLTYFMYFTYFTIQYFNEGSHSLPATHTFIQKWNVPFCLYSSDTDHQHSVADTVF